MKKKVIIIGSGTAGLTIANNLQDHFDVSVVEKSRYKKYPFIFKIPLLIGIIFRSSKMDYITNRNIQLSDGRLIPLYESNLYGGSSIMNGGVHVFGFKSKWKSVLDRFNLNYDDLVSSDKKIFSFNEKKKNRITLTNAHQNIIDDAFINTLNSRSVQRDDMSYSEKESCGPIQNTTKKFFRTSVLSMIKKRRFKVFMNEKVEEILVNDKRKVIGVRTTSGRKNADYVILSSGVVGSCELLLKHNKELLLKQQIGTRIQDHTNIRVNVLSNTKIGSLNEIYESKLKSLLLGIKHLLGIPTVMRGTGATSAAYLDLDKDGEIDTRIQILQFFETGRHDSDTMFGNGKPGFSISINAIHPESKGTISLENDSLVINPNYLSAKKDMEILKLALKYCVDLLKSNPIKNHVKEIINEDIITTDPEKYIKDTMYSGHHLIGGLKNNINSNFKINNIDGLYACDASVFDEFVASNIHSSVVLLADMFAKRFITQEK